MAPSALDEFQHVVCTFDGTIVRCYVNAVLHAAVEVEMVIQSKIKASFDKISDQYQHMDAEEREEREQMKLEAQREAKDYFLTKEGTIYLNTTVAAILESTDFIKNHLDLSNERKETPSELRKEALHQAKTKYTTELYLKKVQEIAEKYYRLREEMKQRVHYDEETNILSMRKNLMIGDDEETKDATGSNPFVGHLSNIAIYATCLSHDRIRIHYLSATNDKTLDATR